LAVVLFAVQLLLSVALVAASALSRVALRRLSAESGDRLRFLVELRAPATTHRFAAYLARQLSLLGGCLVLEIGAAAAGWPHAAGFLVGAVVGVVGVEALLSRSLALYDPRAALRLTAPAVRVAHAVLYPLAAPLNLLLQRAAATSRPREEPTEEEQDEEVEAFIEVGESEGILGGQEGKMVRSIADLDETRVREIMTPRTDIVSIPIEFTVEEARRVVMERGHSRFPVFRGSIDNVVGILHARDLFHAWHTGQERAQVLEFLRPAHFVPETLTLAQLLEELRLRTQIALVVDEYGGIAGLVSLQDLVEQIVGEIRDEHDREDAQLVQDADGAWVVQGAAHVKELESLFGIDIGERAFDTVAGLVVAGLGRVPRPGEKLEAHGLRFEVLDADSRRIHRVRVQPAGVRDRIGTGR
jgi:magnesium and cobalt transporter